MFPLKDDNPRSGPATVTVTLIAVNVLVFLYQFTLYLDSPQAGAVFINSFGAVPAKITAALAGDYPLEPAFLPAITSMFLHGGWMHLLGNMWFLWIFGDNIEDEVGHGPYLLFYLVCGLAASLAHYLSNPASPIPSVGASGAISGVMGAYAIRFPRARVTTLIVLVVFITTVELPAVVILIYWFVVQFVAGAGTIGAEGGGVAWWAHVGGFVAGAALVAVLPRKHGRRRLAGRY